MIATQDHIIESQWSRLGIHFTAEPCDEAPDIERLFVTSVRCLDANPRLLPLLTTWLVHFGDLVASHRLRALIARELEPTHRAALGLILETALQHGAPVHLQVPLDFCQPAPTPEPLFAIHRGSPRLREVAVRHASPLALKWNLFLPEIQLKHDAIRPLNWTLDHNPSLRDRIIRKGDLRTSILETLRHDTGGQVPSESALARLTCATRTAVRKALAALVREGEVTIAKRPGNARDHVVSLRRAS